MTDYDVPGRFDQPVIRNGKGSRRRGDATAKANYDKGWDAIFGKKAKKKRKRKAKK